MDAQTLAQFYETLSARLDVDKAAKFANSRISVPKNAEALVREADAEAKRLAQVPLDGPKNISEFARGAKIVLVAVCSIMDAMRRAALLGGRVETRRRKEDESLKTITSPSRDTASVIAKTRKTRLHFELPALFTDCESALLRLAVAMFQRNTPSVGVVRLGSRRNLPTPSDMFEKMIDKINVAPLVSSASGIVAAVAQEDPSDDSDGEDTASSSSSTSSTSSETASHRSENEDFLANLSRVKLILTVQGCIELAEVLRDLKWSVLAFKLEPILYLNSLERYCASGRLTRVCTFRPLFKAFIELQTNAHEEMKVLSNQFTLDRTGTFTEVLSRVRRAIGTKQLAKPLALSSAAKLNAAVSNATKVSPIKYESDKIYEAFIGPVDLKRRLEISNFTYEGRRYEIVLYRKTLFDVIGATTVTAPDTKIENDGDAAPESELYAHLPWSRRLDLVPYPDKITLQSLTGEQIYGFDHSGAICVSSRQEDRLYAQRVVIVKRSAAAAK